MAARNVAHSPAPSENFEHVNVPNSLLQFSSSHSAIKVAIVCTCAQFFSMRPIHTPSENPKSFTEATDVAVAATYHSPSTQRGEEAARQ